MRHCLVLLATHNGSKYIKEQLDSILLQEEVSVHILVSDDMSVDNTLDIIKSYPIKQITVLPDRIRMNSAAQNFFRLIRDAEVENYDYISFADQDDIWNKDKLKKAIECIEKKGIDAYSSNVIAFWGNGKELVIKKSGKDKEYDYLFGSAGPGCTYTLKKSLFQEFRSQLLTNSSLSQSIKLHDWLIYAFARSHKYKWFVDEKISMKYRQHSNNEFGANSGLKALYNRWKRARLGWYREQILLIAKFCDIDNKITNRLNNNSYWDRILLSKNIFQFRKKKSEAIFLGLILLIPGFK